MTARPDKARRRTRRRLLAGTALAAGVLAATSVPADAATTSSFSAGVLTVNGDSANNSIAISRDAAGRILGRRPLAPLIRQLAPQAAARLPIR